MRVRDLHTLEVIQTATIWLCDDRAEDITWANTHSTYTHSNAHTHTVIIKLQTIVRKSQWKRDIRKARGGTWRMKGMGVLGFRPSRPADGTHVHFSACVDKSPPCGRQGAKVSTPWQMTAHPSPARPVCPHLCFKTSFKLLNVNQRCNWTGAAVNVYDTRFIFIQCLLILLDSQYIFSF